MSTYFVLMMILSGNGTDFSIVAEYNTMEKCQAAYKLNKETAKKENPFLTNIFGTCTPK